MELLAHFATYPKGVRRIGLGQLVLPSLIAFRQTVVEGHFRGFRARISFSFERLVHFFCDYSGYD